MSKAVYYQKDSRRSSAQDSRSRNRSHSDPFSDPNVINHRVPLPPPKQLHYSSNMSAAATARVNPPLADAIRDTVTVNRDHSPRKAVRANTTIPTSAPASGGRSAPANSKRSISQDSVTQAAAAVERAKTKNGRPKKGSQHADVIDRLDFTGVGPMFHHDGPFDACAPSRNRHRTQAPMLAWSSSPSEPIPTSNDSPYPPPDAYTNTFSKPNYYVPPKKRVDAIAEAWGTHEPEPYEDFSAGGGSGRPDGDTPTSSIYRGHTGKKPTKDAREMRDAYKGYLEEDEQPRRNAAKRSTLPPPQPIFVPDAGADLDSGPQVSPPLGSLNSAPKRNKSLMQRIRKMRDSPNVPVGNYDGAPVPPSPTTPEGGTSRPTHRMQNSYLGDQGKDLPATPYGQGVSQSYGDSDGLDYFTDGAVGSPAKNGPSRKTSLMRRVRGVVRAGGK